MLKIGEGDVVLFRPGLVLEPMVSTVHATIGRRTLVLCCGTWIDRASVLRVLRHVAPNMPHPSVIADAVKAGRILDEREERWPR